MTVVDNSTVHRFVSFNGDILPAENVGLHALSAAALYGRGVFTTIAIRDRKPLLWAKHIARLTNDSARLAFDPGEALSVAEDHLSRIIEHNAVTDGRARVTFFDESSSPLWPARLPTRASILITTAEAHRVPSFFRVGLSDARVSSMSRLAGIKSCNYLESLLAYDEARVQGFQEAIRLNELGEIVSGCMSNVFWLKDGKMFTPHADRGCIRGTTREYILENLDCEMIAADSEVITAAEAIFLTSAGLGVVQAGEFTGRIFTESRHPILSILDK